MKKALSIMLGVLLMIITLAGCSDEKTLAELNTPSSNKPSNTTPAVTPASENKAPSDSAETPQGFVRITGGTFSMGSPVSELEREEDENQHDVTVSDFYIAQTEVTQAQYSAVMGGNPSDNQGDSLPGHGCDLV